MKARADRIDCDDVALFIFAVNAHQPRDKQLAPVKAVVFARGHDGSNYSSKNHRGGP